MSKNIISTKYIQNIDRFYNLCKYSRWDEANVYLASHDVSFEELTNALRDIMHDKKDMNLIDGQLLCIYNIASKLRDFNDIPEDFKRIIISEESNMVSILSSQHNVSYLRSIVNIKHLFAENTMYVLCRLVKSYEGLKELTPYVSSEYLNKREYICDGVDGIKCLFLKPFLHTATLSYSEKMFKKLLTVKRLNLKILDNDSRTALSYLQEEIDSVASLQEGSVKKNTSLMMNLMEKKRKLLEGAMNVFELNDDVNIDKKSHSKNIEKNIVDADLVELCNMQKWKNIKQYLDDYSIISLQELRDAMQSIMSGVVDKFSYDVLCCVAGIAEKLLKVGVRPPENFKKIEICNKNEILKTLCSPNNFFCLENIIKIRHLFVENTMYTLCREARSDKIFKKLIPYVDLKYINQSQEVHGRVEKPLLLFAAVSLSYSVFKSLLEIDGINLKIEDDNGKTALSILNHYVQDSTKKNINSFYKKHKLLEGMLKNYHIQEKDSEVQFGVGNNIENNNLIQDSEIITSDTSAFDQFNIQNSNISSGIDVENSIQGVSYSIEPASINIVEQSEVSLSVLCETKQWKKVKNLNYDNILFKELINALQIIMRGELTSGTLSDQFKCIINIAKKLTIHHVPSNFNHIKINHTNKTLHFLCGPTGFDCLDSILKIKDFFVDETIYFCCRAVTSKKSLELLINNMHPRYINETEGKYSSIYHLKKPLLHIISYYQSLELLECFLQIPDLDLDVKDIQGRTALLCLMYAKQGKINVKKNSDLYEQKYMLLQRAINSRKPVEDENNKILNTLYNLVEDDTYSIENFNIRAIDQLDYVEMIKFLSKNHDFSDRMCQLGSCCETVAQHVISLMRYDLMYAILTYTKKIPSSVSIVNLVIHQGISKNSLYHDAYKKNIKKFIELFIEFDGSNLSSGWTVATHVQNKMVLNILSDYINHKNINIVSDTVMNQISLSDKITQTLHESDRWLKISNYIKEHVKTATFAELVKSLGVILNASWLGKLPREKVVECINILSNQIHLDPFPKDYDLIGVAQQRLVTLVGSEIYTSCIKNMISIRHIFEGDLIADFMKECVMYPSILEMLIDCIDLKHINQCNYNIYNRCGMPFLHAVCMYGSKEVLKKLVNMRGVNLNKLDKNDCTAINFLEEYIEKYSTVDKDQNTLQCILTLNDLKEKEKILSHALINQSRTNIDVFENGKRKLSANVEDVTCLKKHKLNNVLELHKQSQLMQIDEYSTNDDFTSFDEYNVELDLLLGKVI